MKKILLFFLIFSSVMLFSQESSHNWRKMGSPWIFENSKIQLQFPHANAWNYYELSNYNSLISLRPIDKPTVIEFSMSIYDRSKSPAEVLVSFAGRSEYKNWLYHIYGIKIKGNFCRLNQVSLIHSDRKDKSLPLSTKNNIFINEIVSEKISLKYKRTYKYRLEFMDNKLDFFIDDKKVFETEFSSSNTSGHIAFSSKNVKLAIDNVRVKKGERIVFEDNFDRDSIYVRTVQAKIVKSEDNEDSENKELGPTGEEVSDK